MKDKLLLVSCVLVIFAGLGLLLYPVIRTAAFRKAEQKAISDFEQYRTSGSAETTGQPDPGKSEGPARQEQIIIEQDRPFLTLWEACLAYNRRLVTEQRMLYSEDSIKQPAIDLAALGWEQEVFARLSVPAINMDIPLYLGASAKNLDRGGAILGQTSLPIGGASTNCVIAGHRTWHGAVQFVALEQLHVGDKVLLTNPWETLVYEVIETKVITPDTLDDIMIQPRRELLTVFTCTRPNTRRFLVICERAPNTSQVGTDFSRREFVPSWDAKRRDQPFRTFE